MDKKTQLKQKGSKKAKKQANKLPANVIAALDSRFGSNVNVDIAANYKLTVGQLAKITLLVSEVYKKKVLIQNIEKELASRLAISQDISKKIALELCGKRFLILNKKWFDGEIVKKIEELGGKEADYKEFISQYVEDIFLENAERMAKEQLEEREDEEINRGEYIKEKLEDPKVVTNPDEEMKSAKKGFEQYLVPTLKANDFELKVDLNIRLMTLFLGDQSKAFQREMLDVLYQNKEQLTSKPIKLKNEQVEPTVGNWLKDYINFVGVEAVVSTIKKAQYYTQSANAKALKGAEKKLLDTLLDLYINIKNFYTNSSKYPLEEVTIFELSTDEQKAFYEYLEEVSALEDESVNGNGKASEEDKSIDSILKEKVEEASKVEKEKENIIKKTRKEVNKVADYFEEVLLQRKRYPIIACLEVLAEVGGLDNLLAKDPRFSKLLVGYFKRNNLQAEESAFTQDPYQAKYVAHFLRYVLLERIGLSDEVGARFAAKISNIFRSKGATQYAQLAYLDLSDNKFKWSL